MALKKKTYTSLRNAAVMSLYGAGVLTLAVAAPNALKLLKGLEPDPLRKKEMPRAFERLAARGYVSPKGSGRERKLALTEKGEVLAQKILFDDVKLKKRRGWDRKWRVIIFDIPERLRAKRDVLRTALERLGFIQLQRSVWVYPHDCAEVLALIRKDLSLYPYVRYIVADAIEREKELARRCGLEKYL